jgi:hypothetical protein
MKLIIAMQNDLRVWRVEVGKLILVIAFHHCPYKLAIFRLCIDD